jgi:hypothetical protein
MLPNLKFEKRSKTMESKSYQWTAKDKWLYALSMIPFLIVFIGAAYLLSTYSIYLTITLIALYLITNIFQAGCCVGCPYRGKYCPALFGVYLGNLLSGILYKNRQFDEKFFKRNAAAGETMVLVIAVFPLYWIFQTSWVLVPIYLILIGAHLAIFMPTQCGKCSYNTTCPGGQAWLSCRNYLRAKKST